MNTFFKTFSKRDFWVGFVTLVIGIGVGMQIVAWAVPDARRWISLYHDQDTELNRMKEGNDWNMKNMDGTIPKSGANATGVTNPYVMRKVTTEKMFVQDMLLHHQAAITMAQQALTLGLSADIANLAKNIISTQATEVRMMQDWLTAHKGI